MIIPLRPGLMIPGKWVMYEYYCEQDNELLHIKEDQLLRKKLFWEIEFESDGIFRQRSNIPVKFFENEKDYRWSLSGNFINICSLVPDHKEVFQFALVKDQMRLLQKTRSGSIVFFGFFKKQPF